MRSPILVFTLLSVSLLAFVMQFGMIAVALDDLIADLGAPIRWAGWVLTIFMIGQVISLSVAGRMSDRIGARNLFALGFAVFAVSSLLCAAAPNIYVLILGRFVQGLGGGSLMPSGMALVAEAFAESRARAVGLYSSILPFGAVVGPTVGGVIVDAVGWRWTFMMNVPFAVLITAAVLLVLPMGERKAPQKLDISGVLLLAGAVTALIFLLTELGRQDPGPSVPLLLISGTASIVLWLLFALQERRAEIPALDLTLLKQRDILAANLTAFLIGVCWIGVFTMVPLYVEEGYGMSATLTGALMAPRAAAMAGASMLAALVLQRTGYRRPIAIGLFALAISLALLAVGAHTPTLGPLQLSDFWWLMLVVLLAGVARGLTNPALNNAGMDELPDRVAAIAGLRATFQSFGGTIGISFMVLLAARHAEVSTGLQQGFGIDAVLILLAVLLVPLIPEFPGFGGSAAAGGGAVAPQLAGTTAGARR